MSDLSSEDIRKLKDLVDVMNKVTGSAGGLNKSIAANTKSLRNFEETREHATKALQQNLGVQKAILEAGGQRIDAENKVTKEANITTQTFSKLVGMSETLKGETGFGGLIATIGVGSVALGYLAQMIDGAAKSYSDLRSSGQSFGGSLVDLRMAATNSLMTLDEFTRMATSSSDAVRLVGVQRMGEMSKQLRNTMQSVGQFGMTTDQTNKYLMDYMEVEAYRGTFNQLNDNQRNASMMNFMGNLDELSRATGRTKDDLMRGFKDLFSSPLFRSISRDLGPQVSDGIGLFLESVKGVSPEMSGAFQTMFKNLSVYGNAVRDGSLAFLGSSANGVENIMKDLQKGTIKPTEAFSRLSSVSNNLSKDQLNQAKILADQGNEGAKMILSLSNGAEQFQQISSNLAKQQKAADLSAPLTKLSSNLDTAYRNFSSIFDKLGVVALQILEPALNMMAWGINELVVPAIQSVSGWLESLTEFMSDFSDAGKMAILGLTALGTYMSKRMVGNFVGKATGAAGKKVKQLSPFSGVEESIDRLVKSLNRFMGVTNENSTSVKNNTKAESANTSASRKQSSIITSTTNKIKGLGTSATMAGKNMKKSFSSMGKGMKGAIGGAVGMLVGELAGNALAGVFGEDSLIVQAMGPLSGIIGMMLPMMGSIIPIIGTVGGALGAVGAAALPVIGIIGAIAGVGYLIYDNWSSIVEAGEKMWGWIKDFGSMAWDGLTKVFDIYTDIINKGASFIWEKITGLFTWISDSLSSINPLSWFSSDDDKKKTTTQVDMFKNNPPPSPLSTINKDVETKQTNNDVTLADVYNKLNEVLNAITDQTDVVYNTGKQNKKAVENLNNQSDW